MLWAVCEQFVSSRAQQVVGTCYPFLLNRPLWSWTHLPRVVVTNARQRVSEFVLSRHSLWKGKVRPRQLWIGGASRWSDGSSVLSSVLSSL